MDHSITIEVRGGKKTSQVKVERVLLLDSPWKDKNLSTIECCKIRTECAGWGRVREMH